MENINDSGIRFYQILFKYNFISYYYKGFINGLEVNTKSNYQVTKSILFKEYMNLIRTQKFDIAAKYRDKTIINLN